MANISAVVNTRNEEENLARALQSIHQGVDEIIVIDMESTDHTVSVAKQFHAKISPHKHIGYVEPARNFAISRASGAWVLLIDADEVVEQELMQKLHSLAQDGTYDYIRLPRKNIIFDKWIQHTGLWPDYQIRFFRKGSVSWGNEIHSIPITKGRGYDLPAVAKNAIVHFAYQNIEQFVNRLNRYTTFEAKQLIASDSRFVWMDILRKPVADFLRRFLQQEGYKDGLHGLAISLLQTVYTFVTYLKVWEHHKFKQVDADMLEVVASERQEIGHDFAYWYFLKKSQTAQGVSRAVNKFRSKLRL